MQQKPVEKPSLLISTKLRIPYGRPAVIRERLVNKLNEGVRKNKIILISAPAGFGKTTLLIEWAHQTELPVTWISLDNTDNDLFQFWLYFFSAIEKLHPRIGKLVLDLFKAANPPSLKSILTVLINEVDETPEPFIIILDDYHVVKIQETHLALKFLIDNFPNQMRLIISSRNVPFLSLPKIRVRDKMVEILANDLRFTLDETNYFFNILMDLNLSQENVRSLNDSTEGWIAGLQIAALSMREREDLSEFIQTFSGSNRHICDYLTEEVIDRQPSEIQKFLYSTSFLGQVNSSLCNAITGRTDSQKILEDLEQENLFIIPLDDERYWYRYHHLLSESLSAYLRQKEPQRIPELLKLAAKWYEENGYYANAIRSFLAVSDYDNAARLVNQFTPEFMFRGEASLALTWLNKLPEETTLRWPMLLIYQAWALISSELHLRNAEERLKRAETLLQLTEQQSYSIPGDQISVKSQEERKTYRGAIDVMYSYLFRLRGDMQTAIEYAQSALEKLPHNEHILRGWSVWNLAEAYRYNGEVERWSIAIHDAMVSSLELDNSGVMILILDNLAELQFAQGQLYLAEKTWHQALRYAEERLGSKDILLACTVYTGLGWLFYEWNDLKTATRYLLHSNELAKRGGMMEVYLESKIFLARLKYTQGDQESAINLLQEIENIVQTHPKTRHSIRATAYRAIWEYRNGNREYFNNWMKFHQINAMDQPEFIREPEYYILVRVLLSEHRIKDALALLSSLLNLAQSSGRVGMEIRALVLQSLALDLQGETIRSFIPLERALSLAEPGGYVRTFLDAGRAMARLLNRYTVRGDTQDYVKKLQLAFRDIFGQISSVQPLIEPLSERELEVLRFIAARFSSREIAGELNISVYTARTHIKNIYSKLNVHSRSEATECATAIGLLA